MYIVTSFFDTTYKLQRSNTLLRDAFRGVVAGAMGTAALNIATYADMAIRGRPSSNAPAKMVSTLANTLHLPLSAQGDNDNDQVAQNRESGLGALLGRSEEHTSELQSRQYLVCRLLLEKKKKKIQKTLLHNANTNY